MNCPYPAGDTTWRSDAGHDKRAPPTHCVRDVSQFLATVRMGQPRNELTATAASPTAYRTLPIIGR